MLAILVSLETPLELGGKIAEVARVRLLCVNSFNMSVKTTPVPTRKAALITQKLLGLVRPKIALFNQRRLNKKIHSFVSVATFCQNRVLKYCSNNV